MYSDQFGRDIYLPRVCRTRRQDQFRGQWLRLNCMILIQGGSEGFLGFPILLSG